MDAESKRPKLDPLLLGITGPAIGLAVLMIGISVFWESAPVIAEISWFVPMVAAFISLTAFCVAYLALGRYQVLCDPLSFWVGIGFCSSGIGHVFYVLAWPGLLPDGSAIIARLTNTPALIPLLNLTIFAGFVLAAVLNPWPEKHTWVGRHWRWAAAAWFFFITLIFSLLISFEQYLPVVIREDGTFIPQIRIWIAFLVLLFAAGCWISTRYYLRTRDALAGYVAFTQMGLVFILLMAILSSQRYDLWWYMQRVIAVIGYLVILFGLLSEYVRLLRRERESEARYRQLSESLPQLIWTCTADGLCDYLSPQWVAFTGFLEAPQLGQGWLERIHPADRQRMSDAWDVTTAAGGTIDTEFRLRRYDGTYRWFKTLALPIRDLDGKIRKWFGSCTDIDDQKRYAVQLERSNRDLRNFTDVASHDLQEPLRKIEAFGDAVIQESSNLDERQQDRILRIRKSAQQMRSMVDGLQELSLLVTDPLTFETVDMNQIAREVLADLDGQIQQSGAVVETGELPSLEADARLMHRLMQKLVENALKFQLVGGKPSVQISCLRPDSNRVQIRVTDNGIGFEQAHADHLFEPFERLVRKNQIEYDGSGMGLTICRWIVERHDGEIAAQSQPGWGTTFIITLPFRQNDPSQNFTQAEVTNANQAAASDR